MINLKENITNFFLLNGFKDLNVSGNEAMAKLGLDFDNLFDYAADKFYPLDCFLVTMKVADLDLIKDAFIVDEAMWYNGDLKGDPKHETIGLNPVYTDCETVVMSSGVTLQQEGCNLFDIYELIAKASINTNATLSIPLLSDEYYEIHFHKGRVSTTKNNLHRVRSDDLRLLAYQMMVYAGNRTLAELLELLNF